MRRAAHETTHLSHAEVVLSETLRERDEARAEVRRLRRALGVYANPKTWGADEWGVRAVNLREYGSSGEIARRALARPTPKKHKSARRKP